MLYHYIAATAEGKAVDGDIDADSLGQVLQFLATKSLRPVTVEPYKVRRGIPFLTRGITVADKVFLTKYLSLMLKVGTDLLSAINILIADFDKPVVRSLLLELRENLTKGRPFYEAFANHPKSFSTVFVSLIRAAETSGNLQGAFEDLSTSLQKEADLRSKVTSALIYPIILLAIAGAVVIFLTTFALPKIADAFSQTGIEPPFFSRVVFGIGLFIGANLKTIFITVVPIIAFCVYFFWKNTFGKRMLDQTVRRIPVISKVYREVAIQRFASTMSALLKAGLPIIQTLNITGDVVGFEEYRVSIRRVTEEGLAKGLTIGEAFRRETAFPKVVTNLMAISERAGHLDEVMGTLADFYASSVEASLRTLVSVLEPILLLTMGLMVGVIAIAIIVPIYQLTSQF